MQNASHYIENNPYKANRSCFILKGLIPNNDRHFGHKSMFFHLIFRLSLLYCGGETVEGPKKKTQDDENVSSGQWVVVVLLLPHAAFWLSSQTACKPKHNPHPPHTLLFFHLSSACIPVVSIKCILNTIFAKY